MNEFAVNASCANQLSDEQQQLRASARSHLRRLPAVAYGPLVLATRYLLSPLAGYTNLSFRRVIRRQSGLGLATTDLVNARGLLSGSEKTRVLTETTPDDSPLSVQIFGHEPAVLRDAAQLLAARGVASIDINMGCPVDHVTKTGAGASLMCQPTSAFELVRAVVEAVPLPVTVKMRLGWDDEHLTAPQFAREFEQLGVAAIAIHGRTRAQGFRGTVNRAGIRAVVEAVERIPVIANGDIRTIDDAARMFLETGAPGISVGRGALANPWIFQQLHHWELTGEPGTAGSFNDRMQLMRLQVQYLSEQLDDYGAVVQFRRMATWYLKAMRVRVKLRQQVQVAQSVAELSAAFDLIDAAGPMLGGRADELPPLHIPVPSGPNERW